MLELLNEIGLRITVALMVGLGLFIFLSFGSERRPEPTVNGKKYFYGNLVRNLAWLLLLLIAFFCWLPPDDSETSRWETPLFYIMVGGLIVSVIYFFAEYRTIYILDTDGIERQSWRGVLRFSWAEITRVELVDTSPSYLVIRAPGRIMRVMGYVVGYEEIIKTIMTSAPHALGVRTTRDGLGTDQT